MAILSSAVSAGDAALASAYNSLRTDLLTGDIPIAGVKTFSSAAVLSAGLKVAQSQNLYFNTALTTYLYGNVNQLVAYVNGVMIFQSHSTYFNPLVNVVVETTKKLYLDGGGDSYIHHPSANYIEIVAGTVSGLWVAGSTTYGAAAPYGFGVYSGKKLYFDDGGDTFDIESSANVRDMYTGAAIAMRLDASQRAFFYGGATISDNGPELSFYHYGWSHHPYFKFRVVDDLCIFYQDDSTAETLRYYFDKYGTAKADLAWSTFSPDIKKDNDFKDKEILKGIDYLEWALKDARKSVKPYIGIKGTKEESDLYEKDICKISIGVARWAEEAEQRIKNIEEALKQ